MNYNISGKQLDLTDSMREAVETSIEYADRIYDEIIDANIVLSMDNRRFVSEIVLNLSGEKLIVKSTDDDMYVAIADMGERLGKAVRRIKEKKGRIDRTTIRDMELDSD